MSMPVVGTHPIHWLVGPLNMVIKLQIQIRFEIGNMGWPKRLNKDLLN